MRYLASPQLIQIYGHRGARGLSHENTLPSYQMAIKHNVDCVDIDVHMTKDGIIVATHEFMLDPNLTRDPRGNWIDSTRLTPTLIKDLTLVELQQYDVGRLKPGADYSKYFPQQMSIDGTKIPTLQEVIRYVKKISSQQLKFQVEIKTNPQHPEWSFAPETIVLATLKVLKAEKIENITEIQSFDWNVLQIVQKTAPHIATAYLTEAVLTEIMCAPDSNAAALWTGGFLLKDYDNSLPLMIAQLGGKIWGPESKELTIELVKEAHDLGLKVIPWSQIGSLDEIKEITRMIEFGVDGIISDRPDLVRDILRQSSFS